MGIETDILYIHPTKTMSGSVYSVIPVGAIALLNLLRQNGYSVYGINLGIEKSLNEKFNLLEELKGINYKILLIDLHWYEHSYGAIEVARISKLIYPERAVILGGFTTTIFSDEIIREFPFIDYAVKGDSEKPLNMLVDYLVKGIGSLENIPNLCYRHENNILNSMITYTCTCNDFSRLDFISIDFFKNEKLIYYTSPLGLTENKSSFWLCIARGCKFDCTYCCGSSRNSNLLFGRSNMLVRSIESITDDMKRLSSRGVQIICPTHDFEMFGKQYYRELFSLARFKDIRSGLYMECFQLPSVDYVLDIKNTFEQQFTTIEISPLTGDDEVRKMNGKNFTNAEFFDLLKIMSINKLRIEIYYSFNLAKENDDSFDKTIEQIEQIVNIYPLDLLKIICRKVVLDPLAPMRDKKYNIKSQLNNFMDYHNYCKSESEIITGYTDTSSKYLKIKLDKYEQLKNRFRAGAIPVNIY